MRPEEFELWMLQDYVRDGRPRLSDRPRSDAKSRCRRVSRHLGDLDEHYKDDGLEAVLRLLTTEGRGGAHVANHRIPINGEVVSGTSSLRAAVKLYLQFCERHPPK